MHRNVAEQQSTIAELKTTVAQQQKQIAAQQATAAQQQKQIEALTATVRKVSDQIAFSKPVTTVCRRPLATPTFSVRLYGEDEAFRLAVLDARALRELGKYKLIYAAFGGSNTKSKVTERQSLRRRPCGCRHDRWP